MKTISQNLPVQVGNKVWDIVIIGGGPAGMMAGGTAGEKGKSVLILEKNDTLGKKLLITGGGRCNVTNNKKDNRVLLAQYKGNDKYLYSAFAKWSVQDTLEFFHKHKMPTKEEKEGRIFPLSNSAQSVWDVLHDYIEERKGTGQSKRPVTGVSINKKTG